MLWEDNKIWEKPPTFYLELLANVKTKWDISSNFCDFLRISELYSWETFCKIIAKLMQL